MGLVVLVEACVLAVLGVLVCGLLRSHAEILRTLEQLSPGAGSHPRRAARGRKSRALPQPVSLGRRPPLRGGAKGATAAFDLAGTTPAGEPVALAVVGAARPTLLAFLSSGCHTCSGFWRSLRHPDEAAVPDGAALVVVTKSPQDEDLARLRELAAVPVPVVMSTEAWKQYAVPVTPYFVLVDGGSGKVVGQGTGSTWAQVTSLVAQASADDHARNQRDPRGGVDEQLLAAGLRPGDPSLYPSSASGPDH